MSGTRSSGRFSLNRSARSTTRTSLRVGGASCSFALPLPLLTPFTCVLLSDSTAPAAIACMPCTNASKFSLYRRASTPDPFQFVAPSPPGSHPHPHHRATISLPIQQRPSAPSPEVALSRVVSNPEGVAATNVRRTVRWTEDLICPSPVPPEQRRKGWYNRRGYVQTPTHHIHTADPASHRDQLWTNDGMYKTAEPGQEYPSDLAVRV